MHFKEVSKVNHARTVDGIVSRVSQMLCDDITGKPRGVKVHWDLPDELPHPGASVSGSVEFSASGKNISKLEAKAVLRSSAAV